MNGIEKLPRSTLSKAVKSLDEYYRRPRDIPEVIEAARASGLVSIGGALVFEGTKGTPSEGVGTCECYWVRVSVNSPEGSSSHPLWAEIVDNAAKDALSQFNAMKERYDFLHGGFSNFAPLREYKSNCGDLEDVMFFEWSVQDEEDYKNFLEMMEKYKEKPKSPPRQWP